jgi:hypothetical protein
MGTDTMGRVTVASKIENVGEIMLAEKGLVPADQGHSVEVSDPLVDTGPTALSMPKSPIDQSALVPFRSRVAPTSADLARFKVYGGVRLTVLGRGCHLDVVELPEGSPVLIGQVPLDLLDFAINPAHRCLIGNSPHGGEQMIEMY